MMEIIRGLLFIWMTASLNTSESKLLGLKQLLLSQGPQEQARTINYNECYCPMIKPNSVQIGSFLGDSADIDLERVVVYFYKNKATNTLVMYTPAKEKQQQIPDLLYNAGDGLQTIGTETLVELYDNSLHTMSMQHHFTKTLPTNSYRVTDYTSTPESVEINPPAAVKITQNSLSAMERPKPDKALEQLNVYENQNSNEYLYYDKEGEMESSIKIIPEKLNNKPGYNGVNGHETVKVNHNKKPESYNFNNWFEEQLKTLPELTYPNNEYIDSESLKTRIVRILREHGLYLVYEYVSDEHGHRIDMSNFQILQMIIEEKLTNLRDEWSPVHEEGVMLVHLNPPYVLGVIPYRTPLQKIVPKKTSAATKIVSDSNVNGAHNPLFWLLDNDKNLETTSRSVTYPELSKRVSVNDDNVSMLKRENKTQLNELVKDLFKTFRKHFETNMITEVIKRFLHKPNGISSEDEPGFRIIGGNAALHSGAPLNNKARSGYI